MRRRTGRRGRAVALVVACLTLLSGCATRAEPVSAASPAPSSPPRFPSIRGEVLERSSPAAGDWVVRIRVEDADRAYADARRTLVGGGYQLTKDREGRDGGDGQACTPRLCVGFSATIDSRCGPSLRYEVFHSTGVVG